MSKHEGLYLLGIDVGTTGCKTELVDVGGTSVARAYREYPLVFPKAGWIETDPENAWWKSTVDTIREVLAKSKVKSERIAGVSISCTNALLPVDKNGTPLRGAVMQLDKRTIQQAKWINETMGEEVVRVNGNRASASGTSAPIILWIKENEPQVFDKTYKFLWPGGFIIHRLTGEFTMEWSRASWTNLFETGGSKTWSTQLCQRMEIPVEKLPSLYPSWEVVGEVTEKAAKFTGLSKGTPVVGGMADTPAAAVGSRVVVPGRSLYVLGTVGRPSVVLKEPVFDSRFVNCCHAVPDYWFSLGATDASGLSIKWFRDLFGQQEVSMGKKLNKSPFKLLDDQAMQSPPGANGIIYLPYLTGERSPIWDPYAKGVFFGLSASHKRGDIIRAVLEGVAYSFLDNLNIYENELGIQVREVLFSGGGANSKIWPQIFADMCGKPVHIVKVKESEAIGNAILAGFGVGIYKSMIEAADRIVKIERILEPGKENYKRYKDLFQLYKSVYNHLKDDFVFLSKIVG